ncbi:MFS transporter [Beijerinckia indica]|uniref:Uncharacterized MFS-type transporter Bind_1513 n=1 Tax=Beijerinckia indica subsp. indica (strain ATCC 9039 / DSM 1715 / NCIMB 8712) TaxID=395963 RepID=B2IB62_BEII9|nr:MFS transporter [Beijerinckia indica]ACB95146.1 major facilitator superfamily MFS_1 [Beijerinckia indica subsp. indica ATCC 9039]
MSPSLIGTLRLVSVVAFTFLGFLAVGLPLAVLPTYVDRNLGLGAFWAGLAVSTLYISTIASRTHIGQMTDRFGPKPAVIIGFLAYVVGGLLTAASVPTQSLPVLSLCLLLAGRLALGIGESAVSTGAISWAMALFGAKETVRIIAWNGIATNASLAAAAPIGAWIASRYGFVAIGLVTVAVALLGLILGLARPTVEIKVGAGMGAGHVFKIIAPYGFTLALAGAGFGVIMTFIVLYFESRDWPHAPLALTTFSVAFMSLRFFLARAVTRFGGVPVARVALFLELGGFILLIVAAGPAMAILGTALAGFGYAAIFPSLGGEAIGRAPPQNRGVALGLYSMFQDVSLGATGPAAGILATHYGYASPFYLGIMAIALGLVVSFGLDPRKSTQA